MHPDSQSTCVRCIAITHADMPAASCSGAPRQRDGTLRPPSPRPTFHNYFCKKGEKWPLTDGRSIVTFLQSYAKQASQRHARAARWLSAGAMIVNPG